MVFPSRARCPISSITFRDDVAEKTTPRAGPLSMSLPQGFPALNESFDSLIVNISFTSTIIPPRKRSLVF